MKKLYFLFGIHNHQPIGNFDWVIESAYEKAYLPFLQILERHPGVRTSFHASGNLLEWIESKKPEYIDLLRKLIHRGQIEPMTGGFYEPILAAVSDSDKVGQIRKLTRLIEKLFDTSPRGMWLAERVWEPALAKPICLAGAEYTVVDDSHFLSAGVSEDELHGYFVTEEEGYRLNIFPISQKLRYMIPFESPEETLRVLSQVRVIPGVKAVVVADDGEKFGVWPGTHELVYEKGWLERFFSLIEENSEWITSIPFGEYIEKEKPLGRIYLPASSYTEMMEWALPPAAQLSYSSLVDWLKRDGNYEKYGRFVRGAFWRNFLVRYPESNRLHKRILFARTRLDELRISKKVSKEIFEAALENIWKAQVNCPYWHGVFGGLYLPHLRDGAYSNLIRAEALMARDVSQSGADVSTHVSDINKDGFEEILVETRDLSVLLEPERGGGIFELAWRKHGVNFANGLARRFEAYHDRLRENAQNNEKNEGRVKTIHEELRFKEKGLEKKLFYDWYERGCLLDHFLSEETTLEEFSRAEYSEIGDFINLPYSFSIRGTRESSLATLTRSGEVSSQRGRKKVDVTKRVFVDGSHPLVRFEYELLNRTHERLHLRFGVEFNLTFPEEGGGKKMIKVLAEKEKEFGFESKGEVEHATGFTIFSTTGEVSLDLSLSLPGKLWRFPVETVSLSEAGLERVFQCLSVMPVWVITIPEGEMWQVELTLGFKEREKIG